MKPITLIHGKSNRFVNTYGDDRIFYSLCYYMGIINPRAERPKYILFTHLKLAKHVYTNLQIINVIHFAKMIRICVKNTIRNDWSTFNELTQKAVVDETFIIHLSNISKLIVSLMMQVSFTFLNVSRYANKTVYKTQV